IYLSGSDAFPRIKIGIGAKPDPDWDLADWVLSKFTDDERKTLETMFDNALGAIELMADGKIDRAMNLYN
ncbi:MAG: aminoacyl-tRNA hydrolase, partial [Ruminococcus sp.]|nr:aminoacyl-tRNA hydrolase [Ruminococcus sp.]